MRMIEAANERQAVADELVLTTPAEGTRLQEVCTWTESPVR